MRTLMVGYRAADLSEETLAGDVTCHALDIYHAHAIQKVFPRAQVVCSADLPAGPWDLIRYRTGPKIRSGELSLDLLQAIHFLKPTRFELDFVGRERERNELLDKVKKDAQRVRSFRAEWTASVPGLKPLKFVSYPGCFCHRRLDEGGLALAEVVSREARAAKDAAPIRLLDMGCGAGLVGLLIAASLRDAGREVSLTLVDSHTRAIQAARENAAAQGFAADIILSDDGTPAASEGTYDIFVGNPPYYSDYRIADVFLATARRALKPGGVCYTVVKNEAGLKPVQERYFPSVAVQHRRNYAVLKSIRAVP